MFPSNNLLSGNDFWGKKNHPSGKGRIHRGTTQIDPASNKKVPQTGAKCRGTTLLRTQNPLKALNADKRRSLLSVQPAAQEGTSSGFINRLAATAGSLNESARVLSSIIAIGCLQL